MANDKIIRNDKFVEFIFVISQIVSIIFSNKKKTKFFPKIILEFLTSPDDGLFCFHYFDGQKMSRFIGSIAEPKCFLNNWKITVEINLSKYKSMNNFRSKKNYSVVSQTQDFEM